MAKTRSQLRAFAAEKKLLAEGQRAAAAATLAAAGIPRRFQSAPAHLVENPNRAKRHAARLDILGEREAAAIRDARRDYRPLKVATPILTRGGRHSQRAGQRQYSSYTV